jgi:NTE family protein
VRIVASRLLLAVLAAGLTGAVEPEAPSSLGRGRVALVLSGGGAKGIAHVGVLKVLEELRIPVDFVVGTSMGAIVGGLYACGWSPDAIETMVATTDWATLFDDTPARRAMPPRQRREAGGFARVELGIKNGAIASPRGLIAGQDLGFLLQTLTLNAVSARSFDELPVPFRAVAADLGSGKREVLDHGNLADAIRASMAVPGVFAPVVIDGKVLVDGGILENMAVDVALASGAQTIIAVYLGGAAHADPQPSSLLDLSLRVVDAVTIDNMERQRQLLREGDELVMVDVGTFEGTDFAAAPGILARGAAAARATAGSLKRLSLDEAGYAAYLAGQRRRTGDPIFVDTVRVEVQGSMAPERVAALMETRGGRRFDLAVLERDIDRVYALGQFQTVDFRLADEALGRTLIIRAIEKPWGPHYLRLGLSASDDFQGGSAYTVDAAYVATNLNRLGGEWTAEASVGRTLGFSTSFYQPLDYAARFALEPELQVARTVTDFYQDGRRAAQYQVSWLGARLVAGWRPSPAIEIEAGASGGLSEAGPQIGDDRAPTLDLALVGWEIGFAWDRIEGFELPRRGLSFSSAAYLSRRYLGANEDYETARAGLLGATTVGRHTGLLWAEAGTSRGGERIPPPHRFGLGGLTRLAGYRPGQLSGLHYGLGALGYLYRVVPAADSARGGLYLGLAAEAGGVWESVADIGLDGIRPGGTLFAAFVTPIGPLYLGYGYADGGSPYGNGYLVLGQLY